METEKILVGISSCLLGEKVRFDTGHKHHSYTTGTLGQYFEFRSFCPEISIGLGVPRESIRLVDEGDKIKCVGTKTKELDVTDKLIQCANEQSNWLDGVYGYIVKKDSPSCGMERVKVYKNNMPEKKGSGLFTYTMMQNYPDLPVEEEGRLGDPVLRENFIKRVFIYKRWRDFLESKPGWSELHNFHARHKYILYSHHQDKARQLGKQLAEARQGEIADYVSEYGSQLMAILKIPATRKNHVNTLLHIQGYLKRDLDKDDKQELSSIIESYRLGHVPLIVPITLLRHHFRKAPDDYINNSYYMNPHPAELMLLNSL